jgi:hypothetical protein
VYAVSASSSSRETRARAATLVGRVREHQRMHDRRGQHDPPEACRAGLADRLVVGEGSALERTPAEDEVAEQPVRLGREGPEVERLGPLHLARGAQPQRLAVDPRQRARGQREAGRRTQHVEP